MRARNREQVNNNDHIEKLCKFMRYALRIGTQHKWSVVMIYYTYTAVHYLRLAVKKMTFGTTNDRQTFLQRVSIASYAKRCTSYRKSVRLSVCLSQSGTVSKRLKLGSWDSHGG